MNSSVLSHKFLKDEIYLYLKPGFLTVSALIIWTVMNPHLLPPKPDATLTLCCSPKPMTSKTARFQKVSVLLFSTLKRKKIMAEKENGYIAGANFVQWKKDIEWRIWNPQSNFVLPSRTTKAVITWTTILKLIYTGYYSKRPGCSLADLHPHFLFFLFGKGLQSHNTST